MATGYVNPGLVSVNGQTGPAAVLDADDVDADVEGAAAAALVAADGYTDTQVSALAGATATALAGKAASSHAHAGTDITSGTVDVARLPTGATGSTVALGNHSHGVATGGTGVASVTAGSYLKGAGTAALVERTPAQVLTDIAALPLVGGTVTGELILNALLRQSATSAIDLAHPLMKMLFTTFPSTSSANLFEVAINNDATAITTWWNEVGHLRFEQRTNILFDHLAVFIGANATASGDLLRTERRDGSNVRVTNGGINQDGRQITSRYAFSAMASFGANYSAATTDGYTNSVDTLGVRLVSDDEVEFRGGVIVGASSSTNSETMFTLPSSAWYPAKSRGLNLGASSSIAVPALVRASGVVTIQRATVTTGTVIWLDGLRYKL